jgi:hypothetical protein
MLMRAWLFFKAASVVALKDKQAPCRHYQRFTTQQQCLLKTRKISLALTYI